MPKQIGLRPTEVVVAESSIFGDIAGLLVILVVIGIVVFLIVLIIKWMLQKKEESRDIYTQDYKRTIELCKIHKNPKYIQSIMGLPQWIASKGAPVMVSYPPLVYSKQYVKPPEKKRTKRGRKSKQEKLEESMKTFKQQAREQELQQQLHPGSTYKLGAYAGSCYTHDGHFNLLVKSSRYKIMGIFPKLLVLKLRLPHIQKVLDSKDRKKTKQINVPPDSFQLSEDIIIINCLGLEKVNRYYHAVNMDENGFIVDTKPYIYNDTIEISTTKQLIDVGRNMAIVAEDWVRSNPLVQFVRKTDTGLTGGD